MQTIYPVLMAILVGVALGVPTGFVLGYFMRNKRSIDPELAQVKGKLMKIEGYMQGQNAALAEFKLEQTVLQTSEGVLFKKHYATLMERLVYKGIPLPWWTVKVQTQENVDEKTLHTIATTFGILAKSADLKSLGFELVSRLFKRSSNTLPAASNDARSDDASVNDRRTDGGSMVHSAPAGSPERAR
jgi:hypothetical protein